MVAQTGSRRPVELAVVLGGDATDDDTAPHRGPDASPRRVTGEVWRTAPPGSVVAIGPADPDRTGVGDQGGDPTGGVIPLLAGRMALGGRTTYYVCHDHVCDLPVTDLDAVRERTG
jgi:hypothetical protein